LSGAEDGEGFAVRVVTSRDSKGCLERVFGLFQGPGVDADNMTMHAILAAKKGGHGDNDAVKARVGVVIEVDEGFPRAHGDICVKLFEKWQGRRFAAGARTVLTWVQKIVLFSMFLEATPFGTKNQIVVGFI
jgi:hypothetical protein